MSDRQELQKSIERCVVCDKPIGEGEGRYRMSKGSVHVQCRGKLPEDEQ